MENQLLPVWNQVEYLANNNVSLIPVRDKQEGDFLPKTPYRGWKKYQAERIELPELWGRMEFHQTAAVAIICGAISDHLEIIDIDVKFKPGIDAVLMSDIKALYPDLFPRLRIHKTPSGGYHILYRIASGEVPGNQKLSGRPATTEELALNPKQKTRNFLETRGEGGYALAPPSMSYQVHQDVPIPVLTWEERCSLISLCKSYSEIIDIVKPPRSTKSDESYYDENPFEHYNKSAEAEEVLTLYGWKYFRHSSQFIWFTRPGKDKGISASFNKQKRVFYIFTASTELDESKGYNPSTILSILAHNDDRKKTYQYLVSKGYGRIKPEVEARIAKRTAAKGRPLPANASPTAKAEHAAEVVHLQSTYPHGVFWEYNDDQEIIINREKLYGVAEGLGYRLHGTDPVLITGYIVKRQTERQFYDGLKAYIKEEDGDEYIKIANAFEPFIQRNGAFTITRLAFLDEAAMVRDTSNSAYKFYNNGYLFITAQEYSFQTYDLLSGMIWEHDILLRSYQPGPESGKYVEFIKLSTPYEELTGHIRRCIGYMAHQYKDETTGYIIVLTEQCQDAKQGGGSGKNIFSSLFGQTTTYKSIPGSQVKYDEKFLQAWNRERIFAVSDVPKKFDFSFLKELSTGSGILKKLFKDETAIPVADMPKFIIQTNFSFEVSDGGLKRRLIPIEFTDFFTKCGGVDVHFNAHFPRGWTLQDWTGFDNFIAGCIKEWLACGLKLFPPALTEGGWLKQFEQTFGAVITGIIEEYFDRWLRLKEVSNEVLKSDLETFYRENNTPVSYRPALQKITHAIKEWAKKHDKQFLTDQVKRVNGLVVKYKWFGEEGDTPF